MVLWELFVTFLQIGFVSFGGGYAMIPLIEHEVVAHGWMDTRAFAEVTALAGMAPGPIATNTSVFVGYQVAGILGAVIALLGMVLPSLIVILLIVSWMYRLHKHPLFQSMFYGLRPIITGLIIYAGIRFVLFTGLVGKWDSHSLVLILIFFLALWALIKWRLHPALVILLSGFAGIAFSQ